MFPRQSHVDRRSAGRAPAAFTFWLRTERDEKYYGAWMIDLSPDGGSCLISATEAPIVGQRVELRAMDSSSAFVRDSAAKIPGHANVLRVEGPPGRTRRVALRFDCPSTVPCEDVRSLPAADAMPLPRAVAKATPASQRTLSV